jgi:hypothetical protein
MINTTNQKSSVFSIGLTTIIIGVISLALPLSFFLLLSQKTGADFGIIQIIYSIIFALIAITFMLWIKSFMRTRPYLGIIIGIIVAGLIDYGIYLKFSGPLTLTFMAIIGIVSLIYLGFFFLKFRRQTSQIEADLD